MLQRIDLRPFLETVVEDAGLHARWLATLSLLEHTGARKIHKSMPRLPGHLRLAENVLQHAAEEARHAFFFRKQIGKILAADSLESAEAGPAPLCRWPALRYFQSLDGWCKRRAKQVLSEHSQAVQTLYCYLAVTYAIEERAVDVYRDYESTLREKDLPIHLAGLLKEEEGHMSEILTMAKELPLDFENELRILMSREGLLFHRFAEALSHSAITTALL
ncbi:MAG: hypothetical protein KDK23_05045 [Leptospiraceae bacterium]|nr:hypothetical protein [Leptospiraceae bacterium]